jgi:hypothetical protein
MITSTRALARGQAPRPDEPAGFRISLVGLSEALELSLLIRGNAPERYPRAALRWHGCLCREVDVSLEEAQTILAALVLIADERKAARPFALAHLLCRRGLQRPCETLVAWGRSEDLTL